MEFRLSKDARVRLDILDLNGRIVSYQQVAKKNCLPGIIACRSILPTQIFRKESTSFASAGKGWKILRRFVLQ